MADTTQFNRQPLGSGHDAGGSVQQDFTRIGTDLIDALGNRAEAIVTEQKARAASEIAALGAMLRNAAQCVEQGNRGAISEYAADMAGEIDRFADRLRDSSWRVLAADVEDFARRWPTLFMASSAFAGFFIGRILMSPPGATAPNDDADRIPDVTVAQPSIRPETAGAGGTLSEGGGARGLPAGEETP